VNRHQLVQRVVHEIRKELQNIQDTKNPVYTPDEEKVIVDKDQLPQVNSRVQQALQRWKEKHATTGDDSDTKLSHDDGVVIKSLDQLSKDTVIICVGVKERDEQILRTFDNVYNIVVDGKNPTVMGKGSNIVDVYQSHLCRHAKGKITVYTGTLYNKSKTCMKIWKHGDLRTFKIIDSSYYQDIYDPQNGRIPTIITSSYKWISKIHSSTSDSIAIYNINLEELSAWDQMILNTNKVTLCT